MSNAKPPSNARKQFGRRLAVVREAAGYETQTAFAEELGMSLQTYSRYERGETEPGIVTLRRIQQLTGVSLNFLISGDLAEAERKVAESLDPGSYDAGSPAAKKAR